jgi:hypothetical protein
VNLQPANDTMFARGLTCGTRTKMVTGSNPHRVRQLSVLNVLPITSGLLLDFFLERNFFLTTDFVNVGLNVPTITSKCLALVIFLIVNS